MSKFRESELHKVLLYCSLKKEENLLFFSKKRDTDKNLGAPVCMIVEKLNLEENIGFSLSASLSAFIDRSKF